MLQIALCDDNIDELSNIIQLVNQYRISKNLSCDYTAFLNGFDLISSLESGKTFDLYCLDIVMPGFSGIGVAKEIRTFDKFAPILFFTSSPEFALESYSVKALDYVLKPITKEKFFSAFDEILDRIKFEDEEAALIVKNSDGIHRILISSLAFAEVMGRSVLYHLLSGNVVESKESFSTVCENLEKFGCFLKTHRSFIVNMRYIDKIENQQVMLQTQFSVPIAQGKVTEIKNQYLAYQMEAE